MIRKLFQTANDLIGKAESPLEDSHNQAADQQLKADLATAATVGMVVTTRLQDHTLPSNSTAKDVKIATPTSAAKKRKMEENGLSSGQSSTKWRRMDSDTDAHRAHGTRESSTPIDDTIVLTLPKEPTTIKELNCMDNSTEMSDSGRRQENSASIKSNIVQPPYSDESPSALAFKGEAKINNLFDDMDEGGSTKVIKDGYNLTAADQDDDGVVKRKARSGKGKRASDPSSKPGMERIDSQDVAQGTKDSYDTKLPIHTRFGSEEPVKPEKSLRTHTANETNPDILSSYALATEAGSEDEAPETMTATAGLIQSRIATTQAAKAVKRQAKTDKEKRQKRDACLKEQAESAKKRRQKRETSPPIDPGEERYDSADAPYEKSEPKLRLKANSGKPLPLLLPDEILAAEPVIRLPTPPNDSITKPKKRKFIESSSKPLKDVRRGSIKVRVLETIKPTLPPKNSKGSRLLKESWLSGQRGRQSGAGLSRRKVGGGFVRR